MEKFIPYEKLSKKEKRRLDSARRTTWGAIRPVTRKPENSKAYIRSKARNWQRDHHETNSGAFHFLVAPVDIPHGTPAEVFGVFSPFCLSFVPNSCGKK